MNDKIMKKNSQPLSLRVPEPSGRPGDAPDFSHLQLDPGPSNGPRSIRRPMRCAITPFG